MSDPSAILSEVSLERWRQKTAEGWTVDHDDDHCGGELAQAAACYADPAPEIIRVAKDDGRKTTVTGTWIPKRWPWAVDGYKPKDRRRDLIRAAALIVAEIERLDRAQERASNAGLPPVAASEQGDTGGQGQDNTTPA
jgi:hypothetical protein